MKEYSELDMIAFACDYAQKVLDNFKDRKEDIPDPAVALSEWKEENQ